MVADIITIDIIFFHTPEAFKAFFSGYAINVAKNLEKLIGWYGSNGHAVGSELTWADIAIYRVTVIFNKIPDFKQTFPKINASAGKAAENERIKAYLKTREPIPF